MVDPWSQRVKPFFHSDTKTNANNGEPKSHPSPKMSKQRRTDEKGDGLTASTRACHADGSNERSVVASVQTLVTVVKLS